ncbi:MAG: MFS transporter [Planctomycetaceae bacterium]|nr:MFS transporter [Planctomycetaceae bacterium]
MTSPNSPSSSDAPFSASGQTPPSVETAPPDPADEATVRAEPRNVLSMVLHQILFRTAWIFKTESVIMPAFLDSLTDAGWVRGLLPLLNRTGQSVTPLLLSDRLSRTPVKSRWLAGSTVLMSLPFLSIGGLWLLRDGQTSPWFVAFFLFAYATFFSVHGVNQASFNTLQGKVIRPERRGRLMRIVGSIGSPMAVLMALLLLQPWTEADPPKFAYIFLFTGSMFFTASLMLRGIVERPDAQQPKSSLVVKRRFQEAFQLVQTDPHLRRLCLLATLFVCSQLLFPHYQRMGRETAGYTGKMLMTWVIAQNLSAAGFSWISGAIADKRGTRSALRCLTFLAIFPPALSLGLGTWANANWYWITFAWLGVVPVTYRMQLNYALELTERKNHPLYVSTVVLSMTLPIVASPLIGVWVQHSGYTLPFLQISGLVAAAWITSLFLIEPRESRGAADGGSGSPR